jgi:uroporphyrinogen-III synthase
MSALRGRTVVVTRSLARAATLADGLAARGAVPVLFPVFRTLPPEALSRFADALRNADRYDFVVFTSAAGVDAAFERMALRGLPSTLPPGVRTAAVGPATAAALEAYGVSGTVVPDAFTGEQLAEALGPVSGRRYLLLRADRARPELPARIRALGGVVADIEAYRTVPLGERVESAAADAVRAGVDAVTLTSPSTVEGFINGIGDGWRDVVDRAIVAVIGPVTAEAARAAGMRVAAEADPHTVDGLIDALERAFEQRETEHSA